MTAAVAAATTTAAAAAATMAAVTTAAADRYTGPSGPPAVQGEPRSGFGRGGAQTVEKPLRPKDSEGKIV